MDNTVTYMSSLQLLRPASTRRHDAIQIFDPYNSLIKVHAHADNKHIVFDHSPPHERADAPGLRAPCAGSKPYDHDQRLTLPR